MSSVDWIEQWESLLFGLLILFEANKVVSDKSNFLLQLLSAKSKKNEINFPIKKAGHIATKRAPRLYSPSLFRIGASLSGVEPDCDLLLQVALHALQRVCFFGAVAVFSDFFVFCVLLICVFYSTISTLILSRPRSRRS